MNDSLGSPTNTSVSCSGLDFNFKLSWAALFWPTTASGHVEKLPMSHLFIFLLCISTVQQVYTGEINVTALRKGKANAGACRINHQSEIQPLSVCRGAKHVSMKKDGKAWTRMCEGISNNVCSVYMLYAWLWKGWGVQLAIMEKCHSMS